MHELSLAQNIVEIVHQHVQPPDLSNVRSVNVLVGTASGVVADSLAFSYSAIVAGTPLASSTMKIEEVPYRIHCRACGITSDHDDGLRICPACGSVETNVLSGTELRVQAIELTEEEHKT
jgi:hydrogenase nickel incorporation protein HypA/HybF